MDPYCIIALLGDDKSHKTRTHQGGGKTPRWGDEFEIKVTNMSKELRFSVFDEDVTSSDKIGYVVLKYGALCFNNGINDWFNIFYENRLSGQIYLETRYSGPIL